MKSTRLSLFVAVLLVVALLSGCQYVEQLKARDKLNKGVKAFRGKNYDEAIEFFTQAVELDPELNIVYEYLGITYMKRYMPGKDDVAGAAIASFRQAWENDPKNVNIILHLARTYYITGDYDQAAQCYEQIHNEIDPQNPMPLFGIGLIKWGEAKDWIGDNGQRAEELFEAAQQAQESNDEKQTEIEGLQRRLSRARNDETRLEIEEQITGLQLEIEAQMETINQPTAVREFVDQAINALEKSNELKEDYMTVRYLSLCHFQKSSLAETEEEKTEFRKQASRLAIKELQLKKQQEQEGAEAGSTVF